MSHKYFVRWTETAEEDLNNIIEDIAEENPHRALEVLENLRRKALHLNTLPERGRIVPELKDHGITLFRELIFAPWRMIYRISGETVYVLALFDSRRNLEDILLDRFL
ncbi:MAG: type II toxin-antitoxin system RelE/ParE family toxin [Nitrospirae bacterium]|nr:type II toxin-antitoxin system RelE/ParE family toxin [Nitrospirota bacterium]